MIEDRRPVLLAGALLAGLGVLLGAFGAHGLRAILDSRQMGWWQTAVDYQMWHGIGLLALGAIPSIRIGAAAALITVGVLLFSGSLYAMALSGQTWLGMVTPLGGTAMIAGWLLLVWRLFRHSSV